MSAPSMKPLVVDGVMRPDLDYRDVSVAVMARYLGCAPGTVSERTNRGEIPFIKHGSIRYYRPWQIFRTEATATKGTP